MAVDLDSWDLNLECKFLLTPSSTDRPRPSGHLPFFGRFLVPDLQTTYVSTHLCLHIYVFVNLDIHALESHMRIADSVAVLP